MTDDDAEALEKARQEAEEKLVWLRYVEKLAGISDPKALTDADLVRAWAEAREQVNRMPFPPPDLDLDDEGEREPS